MKKSDRKKKKRRCVDEFLFLKLDLAIFFFNCSDWLTSARRKNGKKKKNVSASSSCAKKKSESAMK